MKVFGYTAAKLLVEADLSVDEIVRHRIHPWWVDVFDPEPVRLERAGQQLFFTPMREVTFAYKRGEQFIVGILEKGSWNAFTGQTGFRGIDTWVTGLKPLHEPFEVLFREYLGWDTRKKKGNFLLFSKYHPAVSFMYQQGVLDYPHYDSGLTFEEQTLEQITGYSYAGEMFVPVTLHCPMPKQMQWIYQAFADWHPVIFGGSLRDLLLGEQEHDIDFIVDTQVAHVIEDRLKQLKAKSVSDWTKRDNYGPREEPVFEFSHKDTKYHLVCRGNSLSDHFWELNDFSVNQLMADKPNVITASRICLWDLSQRHLRLVSKAANTDRHHDIRGQWSSRAKRMQARGYTILPNLFAQDSYDKIGE